MLTCNRSGPLLMPKNEPQQVYLPGTEYGRESKHVMGTCLVPEDLALVRKRLKALQDTQGLTGALAPLSWVTRPTCKSTRPHRGSTP